MLDYKSSYDLIQSEVVRSLDLKDVGEGYVYLYEVEGNEGFVKIGYTSRDLKTRHEEWEFDCNRQLRMLYPFPMKPTKTVVNARRVEALCHAELNHRRIVIYCTGCLKQHVEWFEISPADAIHTIQKWTKWMAANPYESCTLKVEEQRRVGNIGEFMEEISVAAIETVATVLKGKEGTSFDEPDQGNEERTP